MFSYGDLVDINLCGLYRGGGQIVGKLSDADAYLVRLTTFDSRNDPYDNLKSQLGYPIRHNKLQWGSFSGLTCEFVIDAGSLQLGVR